MKGYHYTSYSNWKKIKQEGLIPYEIKHNELLEYFNPYPKGIWLWPKRLTGISHTGSVLYQLAMKNEYRVVLLQVDISDEFLLRWEGHKVVLPHDGHIENFVYHDGEEGVIYTEWIPPSRIKLIDIYDVRERLR